jgi:acyl transferase domain-containing protein/3-hydroxymyristoyl/3-hydroxydecanoyl-(acyl carrier protein) dehydratase/1-acyl-sn-glycerol-3-phosphate acyltransferase
VVDFEPIAIIGQACILPGALSPEELWRAVLEGRDLLSRAPEGDWRVDPALVMTDARDRAADRTWSDRGGYVRGFEAVFDPGGFAIPEEEVLRLDGLVHWILHGARSALPETLRAPEDRSRGAGRPPLRIGAVVGNLSYPSRSLSLYAESVWLDTQGPGFLGGRARELLGLHPPHPLNRFMSGFPAHLLARALDLRAGAFSLDAACASSLYAIKLACDALHDRRAEVMLAGGVNRADDLFIHVGFCALQAMSASGLSRPFHRKADGLVPAEGAAFVALRRLEDAVEAGDQVLGVIRGVGLANDGRGRGLLVPSEEGQVRAMQLALRQSGLDPQDISLLECHATGTPVGDAIEVRSMASVFGEVRQMPIGSLKGNLGHLITASGAAGLMKVLGALRFGVRPPTLHAGEPLAVLEGSPFRLLHRAEPWDCAGPRRAAVNNFGFGGNNAQLIVEEWQPEARWRVRPIHGGASEAVAIVGLQAMVADGRDRADFAQALFRGESRLRRGSGQEPQEGRAEEVELPLLGLHFPPADLEETLAQQLFVLRVAGEALAEVAPVDRQRTGVLVGMQCDAEVARYGARWRVAGWARDWARHLGVDLSEAWVPRAREEIGSRRQAAGVVGSMPNIPANRVGSQFDLGGPSFTVSAEELSGIVCLELAARSLRARETDAVVVAAVDLCCEPVHRAAARAGLGIDRQPPGDAAVALVLKRLEDARRGGDTIYALLPGEVSGQAALRLSLDGDRVLTPLFGHAHAASGLLLVAAAALCCRHRACPGGLGHRGRPWLEPSGLRQAEVTVHALGGERSTVWLAEDSGAPTAPLLLECAPRLHVFSGADRREVAAQLARDEESDQGPARLVLVAATPEELEDRKRAALALLDVERGHGTEDTDGVYFRQQPLHGELGFVFGGPAGAYRGMGGELLLALPGVADRLQAHGPSVIEAAEWIFDGDGSVVSASPEQKLWGSAFLSLLHVEISQSVLGLAPAAAIGFSSGETNALFALGAWRDLEAMYREFRDQGVFTREVGGELRAVRRAWEGRAVEKVDWVTWRILAPEEKVLEALRGEPLAHLTIVNAPGDLTIGGQGEACARAVDRIGRERAHRLDYDVACHCPELEAWAGPWRELHHRRTYDVPGVRFYPSATCAPYRPTADTAADALLGMALRRVDFPRLVTRAWDDGVRVFVEHGPRDACTQWIQRILGEREHLALALDRVGQSSLRQLFHVAAQLVAAGIRVQHEALVQALLAGDGAGSGARRWVQEGAKTRRYPAHPAEVRLPAFADANCAPVEALAAPQIMEPAPPLPPVLDDFTWIEREAPVSSPGPRATTGAGPTPRGEILARAVEEQGRVAAVHREFLAQQEEIHRQFLEGRERAMQELVRLTRGGRTGTAHPRTELGATAPRSENGSGGGLHRTLSRTELEILASGRISSVLGPLFERQDGFPRQVRLPEPPLLLVDRVTRIAGEPGTMGTGTISTETDVTWDSWYLHQGRMPAGIVVEAGQSDLLLISWLGVDFLNRGERAYRLLGCELTYHGELPRPGETLRYEIHVDRHAQSGAVRLFFFHYDCWVGDELRLSVRHGQAGFFTDRELAESRGILWAPGDAVPRAEGRLDSPAVECPRRRFSVEQVRAFSEGRVHECFGPGFELGQTHVRTPRIQGGRMLLLQQVTDFDPRGGPWGRGYLRVENQLSADDWYLKGHFHQDPCMPGTLMCEGCLQAMAFYLTALGYTLSRDGWRFDPVPDETYSLKCRGQVVPSSRVLSYEVFVEEVIAGPLPTLYADILGTVDGLKIFHGRRMGLRLVPDWPLTSRPELLASIPDPEPGPVASVGGFRFGQASLLACAWGRPSEAFGETARIFDGTRRIARLPGPPYHFMSRVTRVTGEMGIPRAGAEIEMEYDIPADAWYFADSASGTVPFCVLLEAVLQPCGWLAVYVGCPASSDEDLCFRNLDGTGTVHAELGPDAGALRTRAKLTAISRVGSMILVSFEVACLAGERPVFTLQTGFGFFPPSALAAQVGLPVSDEVRARLEEPCDFSVDLRARPERYFGGEPALPGSRLLMLDRVTGYWPERGKAGLGRLRAEKDVDPADWYFKAHFFQDPVQPGSLGIEAMLQLLQFFMLEREMHRGVARPRFEAIAQGQTLTWKYRGQVLPTNRRVTVELEVTEVGEDGGGPFARAEAWLWVDGRCIYHAKGLGLRIGSRTPNEEVLDPDQDTWLRDHRPNYTLPTLPLMSMLDRLAAAADARFPGRRVTAVEDLEVRAWLSFDGPRRLRAEADDCGDGAEWVEARLLVWRDAADARLSRFELVARARLRLGADYPPPPAPLPPLEDAERAPDPYVAGALFHGPAFHLLRELWVGRAGSSSILDAGAGSVPPGLLNQGLLDGAVHGILHDDLQRWSSEVPADQLAYPHRIAWASFHGPVPLAGEVRCETRFEGFDGGPRFPAFRIQLSVGDRLWADLRLVEVLVPLGAHGGDRGTRIAFLRDRTFVRGVGLSRFEGAVTHLAASEVSARDWLRGSVAWTYRLPPGDALSSARRAAVKDHLGQRSASHPAAVELAEDGLSGVSVAQLLMRYPVAVSLEGETVEVRDAGPPYLDLERVRAYGRRLHSVGPFIGEDLTLGLCGRFVRRVVVSHPEALEALRGRSLLYLGNHQVQVESTLFPALTAVVGERHVVTIARAEHREGWVGALDRFSASYPGVLRPPNIAYFDQRDPGAMLGILEQLRAGIRGTGHSVFVHVEGELARACRRPVEKLSSVFIDLALELQLPIVPVRFFGGLPVEPLARSLDFPLGYGKQDYLLGRPILPEELGSLPYADRRRHVLRALNQVGPPLVEEIPLPQDPLFEAAVASWRTRFGADEARAVVLATLAGLEQRTPEADLIAEGAEQGRLRVPRGPVGAWLAELGRWLCGDGLEINSR